MNVPLREHERFMRQCFVLAERGKGFVSPNPLVAALLVKKGRVIATGFHERFGHEHAEVNCLRQFNGDLSEATLYVNLEPCSHYGKTPPCADLLVQRGIRNVVVAMKDPNPLVAGKGISRLRRAGVSVTVGILESEARYLNRFFVKHIAAQRPYVHLKIVQTADGYIGRRGKGLEYISSMESRKLVHAWRAEHDAVLVGAGTILADNPRLSVRFTKGRDPAVVILDGKLRVTGDEEVFVTAQKRRVFLCTSIRAISKQRSKVDLLRKKKNVTVIPIRGSTANLSLMSILKELYRHRIGSVLVEGGSQVFDLFVQENCVDEMSVFCSPTTWGGGIPAFSHRENSSRKLREMMLSSRLTSCSSGSDVLFRGTLT